MIYLNCSRSTNSLAPQAVLTGKESMNCARLSKLKYVLTMLLCSRWQETNDDLRLVQHCFMANIGRHLDEQYTFKCALRKQLRLYSNRLFVVLFSCTELLKTMTTNDITVASCILLKPVKTSSRTKDCLLSKWESEMAKAEASYGCHYVPPQMYSR